LSYGDLDPHILIEIAQRDFEDAKLLLENGRYPNAIFMLQQSIEKAIKSLLIKLGLVRNEKELRMRLSHYVASKMIELSIVRICDCIEKICESLSNEVDRSKCEEVFMLLPKGIEERISEELLDIVNTIKNHAFSKVDKEISNKILQLTSELTSRSIYARIIILTKTLCEFNSQYRFIKPFEESLNKTLIEALIAHAINLLIIAHTPFEEATIVLRYHISTVDEDSLIVWWSKRVKRWIEEEGILTCVEMLLNDDCNCGSRLDIQGLFKYFKE
jgi:HEPN domain-containing protein